MSRVLTPEFRVSFPALFEPTSFKEGQDKKYSVIMLFDKSVDISELKNAGNAAIKETYPESKDIPKNFWNPFRDGDVEKPTMEGYKNAIFLKATSRYKPGLADPKCKPIINPEEIYAGCYGRATIIFDCYGDGLTAYLQNFQKTRDGEPFIGKTTIEDDFTTIEDDFTTIEDDFTVIEDSEEKKEKVNEGSLEDFLS